eukprot:CAMPEP_0206145720 /NCGR_PEP_ID=MMETSP1473-20131121/28263_1 /ASSEMBLY_ACC=CAM_ASM_001109 /TAXON_ID=1461547 /ORGANISM="Stichococcus sp, Strain RCC1054" /LENGTH=104 /DNA_ID=CAMNT_0053542025 /DNA_START=549 /DNA_END=863 /DNA_ORIENTATION=-
MVVKDIPSVVLCSSAAAASSSSTNVCLSCRFSFRPHLVQPSLRGHPSVRGLNEVVSGGKSFNTTAPSHASFPQRTPTLGASVLKSPPPLQAGHLHTNLYASSSM